jgi:hypothetical protein
MSMGATENSVMTGPKDRGARDDRVRACFDRPSRILAILSAIHFDDGIEASSPAELPELTDLGQDLRQESLSAEARVDGHDEDNVAKMDAVFDQFYWRRGIEHRTRFLAELADLREHAVEIDCRRGLGVNRRGSVPARRSSDER